MVDYEKLACRAPADFVPSGAGSDAFSVNFGVGANEEEFLPWTKDLHRFNFYSGTPVAAAVPAEVKIGKMAEIYVVAREGSRFMQRKYLLAISFGSCARGGAWWYRPSLRLRAIWPHARHVRKRHNSALHDAALRGYT